MAAGPLTKGAFVHVIEDQWGRDKVCSAILSHFLSFLHVSHLQCLRAVGYLAKFIGLSTENGKELLNLSRIIGEVRVVTRFLDSPALFISTWQSGLLPKTGPLHHRLMTAVSQICDVLFYVCEHVAYLGDLNLLRVSPRLRARLWEGSCLLWAISLICALARLLERSSALKQDEWLRVVQDTMDLVNAVGWGPAGLLWAGRVPPRAVALLGLLSSLISIRRIARARRA